MRKILIILFAALLFSNCSSDDNNQNSLKFSLVEHQDSNPDQNYQMWFFYQVGEDETAEDLHKRGPSYKSKLIKPGESIYIEDVPVGMCAIYIVRVNGAKEVISMVIGYDIKVGQNVFDFGAP